MFEQISLFNFIEKESESGIVLPPILQQFDKDIRELFKDGFGIREPKYEVWDHVPNLGKRYSISFRPVNGGWFDYLIDDEAVQELMDKYKDKQLDVKVTPTPWSIYISTMWTTKGHKEKLDVT